MNKDYKEKEMLDSGEFVHSLIEKLYEDEILENPFEMILVKLLRCSACHEIEGLITRKNSLTVMVWPSDRDEKIRLQSLLWGTFACNLEMKSDKKCAKCDNVEQLLNVNFIVKPPPILLITTERSPFDGSGKLIKTPIDVPQVLDIRKHLIANFDRIYEISTYILVGSINYKGTMARSGHYITYLFPQSSSMVTCFDDDKVYHIDFDKLMRQSSPFSYETHTLMYIRTDYIKHKMLKSDVNHKLSLLDLNVINHVDSIYFGVKEYPTQVLKDHDLHSCLSASWVNDNIINSFLMQTSPNDMAIFSTRFFNDIKVERLSNEVVSKFLNKELLGKKMFVVPINKNDNHWYAIFLFPASHVILSVDSLQTDNTDDMLLFLNYFRKYLEHHKEIFNIKQWKLAKHIGICEQQNTIDCGIYMLANIFTIINDQYAEGDVLSSQNLRYWIASEALKLLKDERNDKTLKYESKHENEVKEALLMKNEIKMKDFSQDQSLHHKNLESLILMIEKRKYCLDEVLLLYTYIWGLFDVLIFLKTYNRGREGGALLGVHKFSTK